MTRDELIQKAKDMGVVFAPNSKIIYAVEDGQFFAYANEAQNYVFGQGKPFVIEELSTEDVAVPVVKDKTDTSQGKK